MINRRHCAVCGLLTYKWQRINGGPWHCYDGCESTTGIDRRKIGVLSKENDKLQEELSND
jgi:hypothetical protein